MNISLRMTGDRHAELMKHLFPGDGCEAVALLLCGRRHGDSRSVLTVRKILSVPYELCSVRTPDQVQWSTDILDQLIPEIWKSCASVVKVHSHPTGFDRFSTVDDVSDAQLAISFDCLFEEGRFHGSAVALPGGRMFGRMLQYGSIGPSLDSIVVVGDDIRFWPEATIVSHRDDDRRNQQAFGAGTIEILSALRVAVIGCSGTGSIVIEQLARLGVGGFVLVDPDHVEHKNLNRILNATETDAERQELKVAVMHRMIRSLGRGQEVLPLPANLDTPEAIRRVAECDVIFGCVDTAEGRNLANRIAACYVQPYVDVGVSLAADGAGGIAAIAGAVHYFAPGQQSLIERGAITQEQVPAEEMRRLNPERYAELRQQAHIQGVDVDRPAVISVNMLFASLAVNDFLARIHRFRNVGNEEYAIVRGDLCELALLRESCPASAGHLVREIGLGDQQPRLGRASLSE
jgi:molybdopterin/thiamine biosynthesis adenylyltransferase